MANSSGARATRTSPSLRSCQPEGAGSEGARGVAILSKRVDLRSRRPGERGGAAKCDCGCLAAVPEGRRRPFAVAVG